MRFMMIVKSNPEIEAGRGPTQEELDTMSRYNAELVKAGVMLAGEGLLPSSKGARVRFQGGKATVVDGPFTEAKELVAGFWLLQVRDKAEAIEWASRVPMADGEELELRQVAEAEDFGDEYTPEAREADQRLREQIAEQQR